MNGTRKRTLLGGGIESIEAAETQLASGALRGVMMGRAVYRSPAILADVDTRIYGEDTPELATTATTESTTETVYGDYQFDDGGVIHSLGFFFFFPSRHINKGGFTEVYRHTSFVQADVGGEMREALNR